MDLVPGNTVNSVALHSMPICNDAHTEPAHVDMQRYKKEREEGISIFFLFQHWALLCSPGLLPVLPM